MSDLSRTIEIIFSGVDDLSGTLTTIGGKMDSFAGELDAVGQPLANMASNVLKLDAALAGLALAGLAYASSKSIDFESSLTGLKKVIGDQPAVLNAAKEAALELSEKYGVSSSKIIESMAGFSQAGFSVDEALKLAANSLDLVIAGDIDAANASNLLVAALKGFDAPASDATRLIDSMNEVSSKYATSVAELAIGMADISPIAKLMGLSFEETEGILTPVIEVFGSGSEAANGLKTGLLALVSDTAPVKEALAALGVSQTDLNGNMKSGKDILAEVSTAFGGLDENQKLVTAAQLVGTDQAAKMVLVFDNLEKSTKITATAMDSMGSASAEVDAVLATTKAQIDIFKVGIENLGIAVGDKFALATAGAVGGMNDIQKALKTAIDAGSFDPIFDIINEFGNDLGLALSKIAESIPEAMAGVDFEQFTTALKGLRDDISDMFDGIDLTTPEGLGKAFQAIVDTGNSLITVTSGIVIGLTPIVQKAGDLIDKFNSLSDSTKVAAGEILAFGTKLTVLSGIVSISGLLLSGLGTLARILNTGGLLYKAILAVSVVLTGPGGLILSLGLLSAAVVKFSFSAMQQEHEEEMKRLGEHGKAIDVLTEQIKGLPADAKTVEIFAKMETGDFEGAQKLIDEITAEEKIAKIKTKADIAETEKFLESWDKLSEEKTAQITAAINAGESDKVKNILLELAGEKTVNITAKADIKQATEDLSWLDSQGNKHTITVPVSTNGVDKVKKDIEKIPTEKMLEIKLQGEIDTQIATIMAQAETVQTAMEWSAKIDIAEAEAAAVAIKAAFEASSETVVGLADSVSDMFGGLISGWNDLSTYDQMQFMDLLEDQMDMEKKALESQIKLTDAQIEYMKARAEALAKGDGLIKIDSTGLEPALEMVMWQILEKVQVTASMDNAAFLLGID